MNTSTLTKFSDSLRALPIKLAQQVAAKAAPIISRLAQASFDGSIDPYGAPWRPSVEGEVVTLRETGALERFVQYVAVGTKLRVSLGVPYAKFQIGRRPIYPRYGLLPAAYSQELSRIAQDAAKELIDAP